MLPPQWLVAPNGKNVTIWLIVGKCLPHEGVEARHGQAVVLDKDCGWISIQHMVHAVGEATKPMVSLVKTELLLCPFHLLGQRPALAHGMPVSTMPRAIHKDDQPIYLFSLQSSKSLCKSVRTIER
jgi:hypothetical protein